MYQKEVTIHPPISEHFTQNAFFCQLSKFTYAPFYINSTNPPELRGGRFLGGLRFNSQEDIGTERAVARYNSKESKPEGYCSYELMTDISNL